MDTHETVQSFIRQVAIDIRRISRLYAGDLESEHALLDIQKTVEKVFQPMTALLKACEAASDELYEMRLAQCNRTVPRNPDLTDAAHNGLRDALHAVEEAAQK